MSVSKYLSAIVSDTRGMRGRPALPLTVVGVVLAGFAANLAVDAEGVAGGPPASAQVVTAAEPPFGLLAVFAVLLASSASLYLIRAP